MAIDTTHLDSGADKIKPAREALLEAVQKLNQLPIPTAFASTLLDDEGGQQARETLGVSYYTTVKNNGALGNGSDATAAFSAAAQAAVAGNSQEIQTPDIPSSDWAIVLIEAGQYVLSDYVDTGNREVVWLAMPGAEITGVEYLNGRLLRTGSKINDFHHGLTDSAVSFSISANRNNDLMAQVSGITNPNQLSKGNGRDTVALYVDNKLPAATYGAAAVTSYSATGAVLSVAMTTEQQRKMRVGMVVQTRHAPQKYAGILTAWTANSITVSAWYLVDGSATGTPATPPGTHGLDVNVFRKAWALNANVFIDSTSYGDAVNAFELGLRNEKGEPTSRGGAIEANGFYMANLATTGSYYGDAAFLNGGKWTYGYKARGSTTHAFYYDGSEEAGGDPLLSLIYGRNAAAVPFYQVKGDGSTEIGPRGSGSATTVSIDMHSGAADADYDTRIQSSGGTGSAGGGTCSIYAATINLKATTSIDVDTVFRPAIDNTIGSGQPARRWSQVYAGVGTINTSDAREKQDVRDLSGAERRAALRIKGLIRAYRFSDAVQRKGDGARVHVGVLAQEVQAAFEAEGLDPFAYALLCYDEWEDVYEDIPEVRKKSGVLDADGNPFEVVVQPAEKRLVTPAGNRYGVRYDELLSFVLAAI